MTEHISEIRLGDRRALAEVDALLAQDGLCRDKNLDYTCVLYDSDGRPAATGSCFGNTLRCLAVDRARRGEGLLNQLVTHLIEVQYSRGNTHLFVYTKQDTAERFRQLGFFEIAAVEGSLCFLENRRDGFSGFLRSLSCERRPGTAAALVLHANPFTLGHQFLAETAAAACDTLHIFVLSEEAGPISARLRRRLAAEGTARLSNAVLHDTGPYLISSATFPSYFLGDSLRVVESQARLDLAIFAKIALVLGVTARYAGEEPFSPVTARYNEIMRRELPKAGIECVTVPRRELDGVPISASAVRRALAQGRMEAARRMLPENVFAFFASEEARPVLQRLRLCEDMRID